MPKAATNSRISGSARIDPLKPNASKRAKPADNNPTGLTSHEQGPVKDSQAGNYLLHVNLSDTEEPVISRLLSVPPETTFEKLHATLQIAFGWADAHEHSFRVEEDHPNGLVGARRLLYLEPDPEEPIISNPDWVTEEEADFSLTEILEKAEYKGKTRLMYEYDMGDGWEHEIYVLGRADEQLGRALGLNRLNQRIACIPGEGHACAEDCGGPVGWHDLKSTFQKARGGDQDLRDWSKNGGCLNGDRKGLDPYKWDLLAINAQLRKVNCGHNFRFN